LRNSNISPDQRTDRRVASWSSLPAQRLKVVFRVLLAYMAACGSAYAIDPNRALSQYIHQRWGAEQGFPHGPVYAIAQSNDGYLWIGTQSGLVRFDGLNFRLVTHAPALPNNVSVLGFANGRDGKLWMRLEGGILLYYHDGLIERPAFDYKALNSGITAMSRSSQGELLLSLLGRGTVLDRRNRLEVMVDVGPLPRSPILSVAETSDGSVWMGTRGAGLYRQHQGATNSITEGLPDPKVNCLLADDGGTLWVGTDEGLVRWNGSRLTTAGIPESLKRLQVLTLVKDRDANLWVGADSGGLLRLTARGISSLDSEEGRSREAVTALFEDREGNLWVGSDSGIERIRDSEFITYSQPEGLPADRAKTIFVDSENRMWFAPAQGGLWWVKDAKHGTISLTGLDRDVVYSIAGGNGDLWLGRQRGGLTRLRPEGGSFVAKSYTRADGLAQNSVYSVYLDREGGVWAGTLSAGVSALKNGHFTNYTIANGLASNTVASILESSDGTMWFSTPSGLSALSNGRWRTYSSKDGLPSENVNCLLEDSAGVLWVGTASGLSLRGPRGFQVPGGMPAPLHSQVLGLAEDRFGWFWIATSNHVLRVNRDKLLKSALGEGDVREYGLANGLRGVEGVKRHRSVIADPDGRIWFSLNRGISMVDPARLTRNSAPAIAHIQGISADGSPISLATPLHIPGGHQRIAFDFTGLSLAVPERVRFRYLLDGFDQAWSNPDASREAPYTNLPPRHYRFRVVASNPEGVWSHDEAVIAFDVDPLYWQTWWFRALCVVLCVGVIVALYRRRLHQVTAQLNLRSAERLAERTRIAQELHDTLLQGFLSASMQVHVAADILPGDSQAKPILARAIQLMRQVIDEGRIAVRGLRSSPSITLDLEHAFSLIPGELVPETTAGTRATPLPEFRVIVDGERRPLQPLLRDDVYRIGREALANAFRHARAKNIEVELKYSPRTLRLLVRDNGCGIDPKILRSGRDGHWGLSGMKERADRIGARFHVWSSASAGTEVELTVPGQVAFVDGRSPVFAGFGNPFRRHSESPVPKAKSGTVE
jgi:ligand-binding sensor domain-containing protein/signal transduction histidine kinase